MSDIYSRGNRVEDRSRRRSQIPVICILGFAGCIAEAAAQTPLVSVITDVRSVRSLSPEISKKELPVRLRGVVTALSGWKNSFFLEDSTGGISIDRNDKTPELKPGQLVDVLGVTGPGLFAPVAISSQIRIAGQGILSPAREYHLSELLAGQKDSQRIAIQGVVRSAEVRSIWGKTILYLSLATGAGQVAVHILNFAPGFEKLLNAEVMVRGVCGTNFNGNGQLVGIRLFVPDMDGIQIEIPAQPDPYSTTLRPIDSLFRFEQNRAGNQRVRVRGTVTYQHAGKELFIQRDGHALRIQLSQNTAVALGTEIEAVGFLAPAGFSPILEDAIFRKTGYAASPPPVTVQASGVVAQKDGFKIAPFNGLVVALEAELLGQRRTGENEVLLLRGGNSVFTAELETPVIAANQIPEFISGSVLKLVGICFTQTDRTGEPKSFQILLRSPTDIAVVHSSFWWDMKHTLWLLGLTGSFVFVSLGANIALRRRIQGQTREIAESREHYRRILETANDAFIETDSQGCIKEWNQRAEAMFGWTRAEAVGRALAETIIPASMRSAHHAGIARFLKTGQSKVMNRPLELMAIDRKGREIPIDLSIWAVERREGLHFNAFLRDISEKKRAEDSLRQSEAFNHQVLESSPDCIKVLSLTGHLASMNANGCRVMEIDCVDDFISHLWPELWPDENRLLAEAALDAARQGGEGAFQGFCPTAKGTPKWWDVRVTAIKDARGVPQRLLAVSRDITTQKLHQQTADQASRHLNLALRGAQLGIWTLDFSTNLVSFHPLCSVLFGLPAEAMVKDLGYFTDLIHPEDLEHVQTQIARAMEDGAYEAEYRVVWPNGIGHAIAARGEVLFVDSKPAQMSGVCWDVTARKEAEQALQLSESNLREAQEIAHLGHWEFDLASGKISWSDEIYRIFDVAKAQVITYEWYQSLLPPHDRELVIAAVENAIACCLPYELTHRLIRGDGSVRHIDARGRVEQTRSGKPTKLTGTALDVTSRVEAALALQRSHQELEQRVDERTAQLAQSAEAHRRSEAQFRQLADSMPQIVWTAEPDGTLDYYNERWYDFTGFDRNLTGDPSWKPLLHPDDVQPCLDVWYASVHSGSPYQIEYRFWERSSQSYRWHLGRALPITNPDGAISKWFGTCTDIDDYKQAQAQILRLNRDLEVRVAQRTEELVQTNNQLTRTKTWLQAVLDSATQVSIIATDDNGVITLFNSGAERLLGHSALDLVGQVHSARLHPVNHRNLRAQPEDSAAFESIYLHSDGTIIEVSLATSPMIDSAGLRLGWLGIAVDIRARKALERELSRNVSQLREQTRRAEEANMAKSEFLAAMSHEIRTPMNAILGMADLLWESELNQVQRHYVKVFRRAGANLLTLVNDILDLSKIESGNFEIEHVDFDLEDLIDRTIEIIRPKTEAKGIDLHSHIAPDTPTVLIGDPTRLQQILINLLGNAAKFTEKGEIILSVTSVPNHPSRLYFEVMDSGIGIPSDKLEKVFEDFTQAESSTTRRFGGTGLGLGICRRLVSRMGGQLGVRSELGKGSTFYFDAVLQQSANMPPRRPELVTDLVGRQVLIVDNNATNRLIFSEMCSTWGMVPSECASAGAAITVMQTNARNGESFHLILVDRVMPGTSGFELVARIRQEFSTVPILMTTSDKVPGDETKCRELGVSGYAVKPLRRQELLRLICEALGTTNYTPQEPAIDGEPERIRTGEVRKGRILIAEDSEDNQFLWEAYLKNTGYEITFVENGEVAVRMAAFQPFDLILMDMQMPVMDGLTATERIRNAESAQGRPSTPILALTANARKEDTEASLKAGCNSHVSKPISKIRLLQVIEVYIEKPDTPATSGSSMIDIPPELEEAAKLYFASRKEEVPHLIQFVADREFEKLRILAHNMKGTGTSFGFPDLTRLGGLIEAAATQQNEEALSRQLIELSQYVQTAAMPIS